jgi:enoyl-CoA hydratase
VTESSYEFIRIERQDGILTITLDRPPVNAFHGAMHTELATVLRGLSADAETRVVILTGNGRHFCAGGDLAWFEQLGGMDKYAAVLQETYDMLEGILNAPQPVIAMVNGSAIGLGASLALCCDIVYAAENARFADPHVQVGLVAGDGGAALWPLLIGPARAKEYLLTGEALLAPEAARIGLINRAFPAAELKGAVAALATKLAQSAPLAVRWTKSAVNQGLKAVALQVLATSAGTESMTFRSEDCREATTALKEKRKPVFRGL